MVRRACVPISGIVLIDKPSGMTSNDVLQIVKRRTQACKAGHTGSLDPLATGLLPVCLGEATKLSQFLLDADKTYWTRLRLGQETTTFDAEGEVVAERAVEITREAFEAALPRFTGVIEQLPPMYSAVKVGGQPLYRRARRGESVERQPRRVTVHTLVLRAWAPPFAELEMRCSKGTYVRTLVHDLGLALGCGAHVVALRRLALGRFSVEEAVPLEGVETAALRPADAAVEGLPAIRLAGDQATVLRQGQVIRIGQGQAPGLARLYGPEGLFLGLGDLRPDGCVVPRRLVADDRTDKTDKSVEGGGSPG